MNSKIGSRMLQLAIKIIIPYIELTVVRLDLHFCFRFLWSAQSIVTTFATIQLGLHGRSQLDEVQTPTLSLKSIRTHNRLAILNRPFSYIYIYDI